MFSKSNEKWLRTMHPYASKSQNGTRLVWYFEKLRESEAQIGELNLLSHAKA